MQIVIGLGETGRPLFEILGENLDEVVCGYDINTNINYFEPAGDVYLHICIPYSENFVEIVKAYQDRMCAKYTIIHSTVPIGTTAKIPSSVHSPILGRHKNMKQDIKTYSKWIGGQLAVDIAPIFRKAGFRVNIVSQSRQTEAMKLLCLAKYGMSIAFAHYCKKMAEDLKFDFEYADIILWDAEYNSGVDSTLKRPLISLVDETKIGGHCVIQNTKILNAQYPNPILQEILKYE